MRAIQESLGIEGLTLYGKVQASEPYSQQIDLMTERLDVKQWIAKYWSNRGIIL